MITTQMRSRLMGACAAVTLMLPAAMAAQASVSTDVKAVAADTTERGYVELLTKAHTTEIEAGRNALATTQNADVRAFAQKLVDDHTKALERLTPVATRLGASTMAGMTPAAGTPTDSMGTTAPQRDSTLPPASAGMGAGATPDSGLARSTPASPTSDKQFIDAMVVGHQQLLGKLPEDGRGIKDKELRTIVSDTRKSVQKHFTMAREIQTKMGGREK
jgi:predicted outer membrane protein